MPRSEAPEGKAVVWPKLVEYAKKNGIVIDYRLSPKVEWMEEHNGVCFCSWDSGRVCPCGKIESDFKEYRGQCLCGLFLTYERLAQKEKYYRNKMKKKSMMEDSKE